jgi:dimethylargininase
MNMFYMAERTLTRALVRPPGRSFARAISSTQAKIDVDLAQAQHKAYCQALEAAGLRVTILPIDEAHPDSCFMQDPAMIIGGRAIIGRMAAASRQGEEVDAAAALVSAGFRPQPIVAPGTLEGGDVQVLPGRALVGETGRSNAAGIAQLAAILGPAGIPVAGLPVDGYLHLGTALSYLGQNMLLSVPAYAGHPAFAGLDVIAVPGEESYAANVLSLGASVIVPDGFPAVAATLRARGFDVLRVPVMEFEKADGGVTCLSLVW